MIDTFERTILFLSSVEAKETHGGEIILFRHLCNHDKYNLVRPSVANKKLSLLGTLRRLSGYFRKINAPLLSDYITALGNARWLDESLPSLDHVNIDLILTVAHGDAFIAARRIAKRLHKPLVSIFHDWWPEMVSSQLGLRKKSELEIQNLYRDSDLALCVCEGMQHRLGNHSNSHVLYPIPASVRVSVSDSSRERAPTNRPVKIVYFGNLGDYGSMLCDALNNFAGLDDIVLQVRGQPIGWSKTERIKHESSGCLLKFEPRRELDQWLDEADMYLVCMSFEPSMRLRMETSFPSKMVEYAKFGKPLIIWGPEYCSAIKWGESENKAICVTQNCSEKLVERIREVAKSPDQYLSYCKSSSIAARTEFCPTVIQDKFDRLLRDVVLSSSARSSAVKYETK